MERNELTTDELSETYLDIQTKINKVKINKKLLFI